MAKGNNNVPERLINFRVYKDDKDLLGVATIELPEIEAMSDSVSGAGIAGEVESPVLGHYGAMETTITWRTIEKDLAELSSPKAHNITARGSQQVYDAANGSYSTQPVRVSMRVVPKTISLGSFEPGSVTDSEQTFEVLYLKVFVNNKAVIEIDKFNYKAKFGNDDVLKSVRSDLGLE